MRTNHQSEGIRKLAEKLQTDLESRGSKLAPESPEAAALTILRESLFGKPKDPVHAELPATALRAWFSVAKLGEQIIFMNVRDPSLYIAAAHYNKKISVSRCFAAVGTIKTPEILTDIWLVQVVEDELGNKLQGARSSSDGEPGGSQDGVSD